MNCFTVPPLPHTPPPAAHSVHTVTTLPSPGSLTVIPQCPVSQSDSQTLRFSGSKYKIFQYFEFEKIEFLNGNLRNSCGKYFYFCPPDRGVTSNMYFSRVFTCFTDLCFRKISMASTVRHCHAVNWSLAANLD